MKKDPLLIIREIFAALESGRPFSLNQLSEETGLHNVTVRKYIKMIEFVRHEPSVEVIRTRSAVIVRCQRQVIRRAAVKEVSE